MREKGEFMQISHKLELQDLYYSSLLDIKREAVLIERHEQLHAKLHRERTKSDIIAGSMHEDLDNIERLKDSFHELSKKSLELPDIRGFLIPSKDPVSAKSPWLESMKWPRMMPKLEPDLASWNAWASQKKKKNKKKAK